MKTYQDHTFSLSIPLELDDKDLDLLNMEHLSWFRFAQWIHIDCSPIRHYGGGSFKSIFTWSLSPKGWQASSMWSFWDAPLGLSLLHFDDDHHLTSSTMGYMNSSFWCKPMERYITPHRYTTHTYHVLVHKTICTILTIPWSHMVFLLAVWVDQLINLLALCLDQPSIFSSLFIIMMSWR